MTMIDEEALPEANSEVDALAQFASGLTSLIFEGVLEAAARPHGEAGETGHRSPGKRQSVSDKASIRPIDKLHIGRCGVVGKLTEVGEHPAWTPDARATKHIHMDV